MPTYVVLVEKCIYDSIIVDNVIINQNDNNYILVIITIGTIKLF